MDPTEPMDLAARLAWVRALASLIDELDLPESADALDTRQRDAVDIAPFRALLWQLPVAERGRVAGEWLLFTSALGARRPTRHGLRVALAPLAARLGVAERLAELTLARPVAPAGYPEARAARSGDDVHGALCRVRASAHGLDALADELATLERLDALDVLSAHPELQAAFQAMLARVDRAGDVDGWRSAVLHAVREIRAITRYERELESRGAAREHAPYLATRMHEMARELGASADELEDLAVARGPVATALAPAASERRGSTRALGAVALAALALVCIALLPWHQDEEPGPACFVIDRSLASDDVTVIVSHGERLGERTQVHVHLVNTSDEPQPATLTVDGRNLPTAAGAGPGHDADAAEVGDAPKVIAPRSVQHRVIEVRDARRRGKARIGLTNDLGPGLESPL